MQYLRTRLKNSGEMVVETTSAAHAGEFVVDSTSNNIQLPYGLVAELTFTDLVEFRSQTSIPDGTYFKIVSPPGEFRYVTGSGANWAADDKTILKLDSVATSSNGRAFSTRGGATVATFAALRNLKSGFQDHIHVQSHTSFNDGGGGIFDVVPSGSYVDDGGTVAIAGNYAFVRRDRFTGDVNPKWWGGRGDYNRTSNTGGDNDDTAIHSALTFATTNSKVLNIPNGNWKLTSPLVLTSYLNLKCQSFTQTILHCTCNTPLLASTPIQAANIQGGSWLATGGVLDCCFDLLGAIETTIDIAVGGPWVRGIQCYRDTSTRAVVGYWYVGSLTIREFLGIPGVSFPTRPNVYIYFVGEFIDVNFHLHCNQAQSLVEAIHIENFPGSVVPSMPAGISHSIKIDGLCGGTGGDVHFPAKGIYIKGISSVNVGRIYAEACVAALYAENCWGIECTEEIVGDSIVFDNCTNIRIAPQHTYINYIGCTGVQSSGGGFGTVGLIGAWTSNNIDPVDVGFSFQAGQIYSKAGWTAIEYENILLNGDFARWTSTGQPWGWTWTLGPGATITKCGEGQIDTTKTINTPYCAHFVGNATGSIVGLCKLTGPLGNQFLSSTLSFSAKIKHSTGVPIFKISNSSSVGSGELWMHQNTTPCENGFVLFTGQCKITANELSGLYLLFSAVNTCDVYVSEIAVHFGRQVSRNYITPRKTIDGSIERNSMGILTLTSPTIPGSVDPFYNKTYLDKDFAINSGISNDFGWTYLSGTWQTFGTNEHNEFITQIRRIDVNNKIISLVLGEDFTGVGSWRARIGANCTSAGTGQAITGTIRNRKAALFISGSNSIGYTLPTNCAEYWGVARFDGTLPLSGVTAYPSIIGGAGPGARLMINNGTSDMLNDCTITRDNISSVAVDNLTRIWRATDILDSAVKHIGSYGPGATNNWSGSIGLAMAVSSSFTAEEADGIYNLIKSYFAK